MKPGPPAATDATRKDLVRTSSFLWIWGLPAALVFFANAARHAHWLSFVAAGLLMTFSVAWIGIACYINGRRCGRAHCVIDGYLLPLLAVLGVLNVAGVTAISWQSYLNIFALIVVLSFVPECFGAKYLRRGMRAPAEKR